MLNIDELTKPINLEKNAKKYSDKNYTWTEIKHDDIEKAMFDLLRKGIEVNTQYGNEKGIKEKVTYLVNDMYYLLKCKSDYLKYDSYLIKRIVAFLSNFPKLILRDIDYPSTRDEILPLVSDILTLMGIPKRCFNKNKLETSFRMLDLDSEEEVDYIRSLPRDEDEDDLDKKYLKKLSKPDFNFYKQFEKRYRPNNIYYDLKLNSKLTISYKLDKNGKLYYGFKKKEENK